MKINKRTKSLGWGYTLDKTDPKPIFTGTIKQIVEQGMTNKSVQELWQKSPYVLKNLRSAWFYKGKRIVTMNGGNKEPISQSMMMQALREGRITEIEIETTED